MCVCRGSILYTIVLECECVCVLECIRQCVCVYVRVCVSGSVCVSWNGVEEPGLRVEGRGLGLRVEVESRGTANA